jgi:site-specific DNA-cytosine methylase
MKILIGCEYSGTLTNEFLKLNYDAISCDIIPSIANVPHLTMDIFEAIKFVKPDCLIAFPPCTYLSSAGLYLCHIETYGINAFERIKKRSLAINFFLNLYFQDIKHIALENPVGHINTNVLKPTQIIHPYYFGENRMKRTCLWLKNLPALQYTLQNDLFEQKTSCEKPKGKLFYDKPRQFTDMQWGKNNKNDICKRSELSKSFAKEMATQWSKVL